jgi:ElaB/YqjD/DUF883 family membrane-anchored ribosome-binding protein
MTPEAEAARAKLVADFRSVIQDTEELLRATANQSSEGLGAVRDRVAERLERAKEELAEFGEDALARGKAAARTADEYVRAHPWESIGVAAAVGLLVGLLTGRR